MREQFKSFLIRPLGVSFEDVQRQLTILTPLLGVIFDTLPYMLGDSKSLPAALGLVKKIPGLTSKPYSQSQVSTCALLRPSVGRFSFFPCLNHTLEQFFPRLKAKAIVP